MNATSRVGLLALAAALSACAALEGDKVNYKSASQAPTLEVPPDLTQLARDSRYAVPGSSVSAAAMQAGQAAQPSRATSATAANSLGDVRIERDGKQRWLVVNRPADQLWTPVKDFWAENGFNLVLDQSRLGIMETDWAENRAKLPQDFIRKTLGKVIDSLYDTGERDKFRTRLERNAQGGTDIYITHRGMAEVYSSTTKDTTVWQPRPSDAELETEFLRRLMVKLGVSEEQAKAVVAAQTQAPLPASAQLANQNGTPVIQLQDPFDRAWRRVGVSLDRTGFTVEDRNRNDGLYFVRYVAPGTDKKEPGFFSKLFGAGGTATPPLKYRVQVRSQGNASTISVLNEAGAPESSANAERILKVLAEDLK